MNTSSPTIAAVPARFGLIARLGVIAAVVTIETLLASYLIQATPIDALSGPADLVRHLQHWVFRFIIAYAVSLALLVYLRGGDLRIPSAVANHAPVRIRWAIVHVLLLVPFGYLSAQVYAGSSTMLFAGLALAWHACALAAALALFAALAPLRVWTDAFRVTKGLTLFAVLPAGAAVIAIRVSQMLWAPAAKLTFRMVLALLRPFIPTLQSDPVALTLSTDRFAVQIAEICSGLEGVGLMLAFCAAWLWFFRREFYFPRALLVIPAGVVVMFLLNAVRIAALVMIGDAGYDRIATVGFHSQAGWIAFNLAAFALAILAHNSPWISRVARRTQAGAVEAPGGAVIGDASGANPTAAFLMPLLVILAAGMLAHLLSAGFELLYPLRLVGALAALWIYRRSYAGIDFRCGWRGPAVGVIVFVIWAGTASLMSVPAAEPPALSAMPGAARTLWIVCRVLAAVFTVPIAEELAYRGFLLRRLASPRFESVPFSSARWPALVLSALAFGITHGGLWLPGIAAGLAYGALAMRTNKLGESIVAHGTTNALLAGYVLVFNQWQLW